MRIHTYNVHKYEKTILTIIWITTYIDFLQTFTLEFELMRFYLILFDFILHKYIVVFFFHISETVKTNRLFIIEILLSTIWSCNDKSTLQVRQKKTQT